MSKSALATLTAQYTDSENEDEHEDESNDSQSSQVIIPKAPSPKSEETTTTKESKKRKRKKSVRRLVSYQDDTIISDEDEGTLSSDTNEESEQEDDEDNEIDDKATNSIVERKNGDPTAPMEVDNEIEAVPNDSKTPTKTEKSNKYAHYGFSLPPEPKGKPAPELVEKIRNLYEKMETNNMDMNRIIQERKEFRNPSIYEKLIQFCDINEFGTNYPPEIYDPLQWGPESYYEELARVQKNEMLKRQKERKDMDKIEQATALARKVEVEAKKRKSKWDQPAAVKTVVPAALTTTVTGTKGTVISAFGSLPKKPAA